jgi:hypothetical protein
MFTLVRLHVKQFNAGRNQGNGSVHNVAGGTCEGDHGSMIVMVGLYAKNGAPLNVSNRLDNAVNLRFIAAF